MAAVQTDRLGSAWMVVAALMFALMGVLVKAAGQRFGIGAYELVFWRSALAVVWLAAAARLAGKSFRAAGCLKLYAQRCAAGTAGLVLFFYGITHLPLGTAVTLNYTSAMFLAVFSVLVLRERPPLRTWAALAAGLAGVAVLLRPSFAADQLQAALLCLASGACAGYAYLTVNELARAGEPSWRVVFYFSLTAAAVSALMAGAQGWHAPTAQSLPYLTGIAVTALAGQLALTRAYQVGRKFTVAALSYLTVLFAALAGAALWGDSLHAAEAAGMLLIVGGGMLSSLR